jgi:tRNA (guanine-N7-)-methyltransferase
VARSKLKRFRENLTRTNVIEAGKPLYQEIKGNWHQHYFKNDNPIVLELACGHGEYTIGLAGIYPQKNYIGIDIKGARIWQGSSDAESKNLKNVAFVRSVIRHIEEFFEPAEVAEIWIIFPDPRPRDRDVRKRLTHPNFLKIYKNILKPGGEVKLKTDDETLYFYTLDVLKKREDIRELVFTEDLSNSELLSEHHQITTKYENKFAEQGKTIKYLKFKFIG